MRIHTKATEADLYAAAAKAGVDFERQTRHGSRTHDHAFDVILSGSAPYRAQAGDFYAASWDEWGIFLAHLFKIDPSTKVSGVYADAAEFAWKTGDRFETLTRQEQHTHHRWDHREVFGHQSPGSTLNRRYTRAECKCGAVNRWRY